MTAIPTQENTSSLVPSDTQGFEPETNPGLTLTLTRVRSLDRHSKIVPTPTLTPTLTLIGFGPETNPGGRRLPLLVPTARVATAYASHVALCGLG